MDLTAHIRDIPDFPHEGIMFKDITPLLADHAALAHAVTQMAEPWRGKVDVVAGIEARGFMFGVAVAQALGVGFVPIRKAGKLPHDVVSASYDLEYGTAEIEVHADAFSQAQRVLVVDDVLATGGTAAATAELVVRAGGSVAGFAFLIELGFLDGAAKLDGTPHTTVLTA